MVATGIDADPDNFSNNVEVIDLADASTTCDALEDYPIRASGASGGLLSVPLICGGAEKSHKILSDHPVSECYIVGSGIRDPVAKLLAPRVDSAAVAISSHQLWVTGGTSVPENVGGVPHYNSLKSTEIVDVQTSNVVEGPELPWGMSGHCVVQLNQFTFFFLGGGKHISLSGSVNGSSTFFYDARSKAWTNGPDMNYERKSFGCGIMKMASGSSMVVVTGGIESISNREGLAATEFLNLGDPNGLKWSSGNH